MMKKSFFLIAFIFVFSAAEAQYVVSKYRISFTDKNDSPYTIENPAQYLSARAIERRERQHIAINTADLPVNSWYIDSVRNTGAQVYTVSKWFNCITVGTTDTAVLSKISALPFVADIDSLAETSLKKGEKLKKRKDTMDGSKSLGGLITAADGRYMNNFEKYPTVLSTGRFEYGNAYNQIHMIGTDYLHKQNYCGQGMVIAVLDAGFYKVDSISVFDSLWANNRILGTKDFVEPGGNVFARSTHGMMVLSIMGGNVPGGLIGTAPEAEYWLLRSEDSDSEYPVEEDNWVVAAEFADSVGADIINSSLGYTDFFNPVWDHTYAEMNGKVARASLGAEIAAGKGILVCNSAGNSGNNDWHYIGAPADAENVLTVGAVDKNGKIAPFSSRGPTADGRVKPSVCAIGQGTFVSSVSGNIMSGNGTSFSSPVMAGSVACLWQANLAKTNLKIMEAVIASSSRFLDPDDDYGYGIPNMSAADIILKGDAIHNFDTENAMTVFPNPFTDMFQIVFYSGDTSAVDVQLIDLAGKIVFEKNDISKNPGCNNIIINLADELAKGYYMLKVASETNTITSKIMKLQ
ncbi:MAG TPA: S8 family serine peptidase [Bacteroidales bacterium]|nr:S8 family serine peptidase [Bacteroidales bacterium]